MRVIIVGGGFCGTLLAKRLSKNKNAEVVLIDRKDQFTYVPSMHKLIFSPSYKRKITVPYGRFLKGVRVVVDEVMVIRPGFVETKNEHFSYDFLVICTGVEYPIRLENRKNVFTWAEWRQIQEKLPAAQHILVIGGGLIGVEIAGEIASKSGKALTIVHPAGRLLERNPESASRYAQRFFAKRNAQVIFGEKVVEHDDGRFVTDKGNMIMADMAIWCAGIRANPYFMKDFPESIFTERHALNVNEFLQLHGYGNIFVGGDISGVNEEKTAHNAELHAKIIAKNIGAVWRKKKLTAHEPGRSPMLISLGDWKCILSGKRWSWGGFIPALLKKAVELMVVWRYRR